MIRFLQFIKESELLDKASVLPKDKNWLSQHHTKQYTDSDEEVKISDLGLKMSHEGSRDATLGHTTNHFNISPNRERSYKMTKVTRIDPKDAHFSQPSVNKGKVKYFIDHYHPDKEKEKFNQEPDEYDSKKHSYPHVTRFHHNGKIHIVADDHHRLVASALRGDADTPVRASDFVIKNGKWTQVKTLSK